MTGENVKPVAVTLDEVARLAGVARSTASRALNDGVASPAAILAVNEAVRKLGFVPNQAARTLARSRTDSVALVIPEDPTRLFSDPVLATVITRLSVDFWREGLQPLLVLMDPKDLIAKLGSFLNAGNVDGMVVTSFHSNPEVEELISASRLPTVFFGRPPMPGDLPYVDIDNVEGGYKATKHLLDTGRRRIACAGGLRGVPSVEDRREGFLKACAEADVRPGPYLYGEFESDFGVRSVSAILEVDPDVDGIFAQSDAIAAGVLTGLSSAGRSVPDDVAVVGFDNTATATTVFPKLTTVAQPIAEMAGQAASMLLGYLSTREWGQSPRILPTELVVRDSA
jgi:DNA-binding LacI/PurR family transcriptional regulator